MNRTIKLYTKQIQVYRELIEELEHSLKVFENFDGKVINVKLEKALQDNRANEQIRASLSTNRYSNLKQIMLYNNDRSIKTEERNGYCGTAYVDYEGFNINIQNESNDRLNYELVKEKTLEMSNNLKQRIIDIEYTITNYDNMVREYKEINEMIAKYKKMYNSSMREHADCNQFNGY